MIKLISRKIKQIMFVIFNKNNSFIFNKNNSLNWIKLSISSNVLKKFVLESKYFRKIYFVFYYISFISIFKKIAFSVKMDIVSKNNGDNINVLNLIVLFFLILLNCILEFFFLCLYILCFFDRYICLVGGFYRVFSIYKKFDLNTLKTKKYYFNKYSEEVKYKRIKK